MKDDDLKMTPGDLEAVESAEAYANRVNQRGVASERPERDAGEPMEGAPSEGAPTDNGEVPPAADSTVREGGDAGGGQRAPRVASDPNNPLV